MNDHFNRIYMNKTHSTKTLRWPINLAARKSLACIVVGFLVCFFFSCSQSKSYSCGKAELRQTQKGEGMRDEAHCLLPSPPPSSFSFLSSAFAPLKLLLYQTQKKNTHQKHHQLHRLEKHFSCCQRHALNILSYKTVIHITDENGRPDHLQNQYLPLLHNWTVCQRKNVPSWSVSML